MDRPVEHCDGVPPNGRGSMPWLLASPMQILPLAPLQAMAHRAMHAMLAHNPSMLARLGEHAGARFAIDPVDCPIVFLIEPRPAHPRLTVARQLQSSDWDARISGNLVVLLGLLEGAYDGDALFFSRDLTIEGDTAAVLSLRNAIEDADLDTGRVLGLPDHLAGSVSWGASRLTAGIRSLLGAPVATGLKPGPL
jgi:predicted lipid carrier protein YhbT